MRAIPNIITWLRVALVFVVAAMLYNNEFLIRITALFLMVAVIFMDAIDGYIARKCLAATASGALLDICADRIVEIVLLIAFSNLGIVPVYIPIIFFARGILTDLIRTIEFRDGKTPFEKKASSSWLYKTVVSGRTSRGLYGFSKVFTFGYLILIYSLKKSTLSLPFPVLDEIGFWLVIFLVAYNLARGLPVIYEKRRILFG